ncbi:unnamed protein product [Paramecium sonneborni]|uniref:Uncharacterized protein n=1 Tax=Paramecium sonneborni TaxID=65129 RepID=A0A8S1KE03_9CILI|nr:unnamed protein product [Paramecium sonneborni]
MKSHGNEMTNIAQTNINLNRVQRMKLRSRKQHKQSIIRRKMAGNNSTQPLTIIRTKSLRKHKKIQKKTNKSKDNLLKDFQQKDKKNIKQVQETKQYKNKQTISQRSKRKNEKLQEQFDTQIISQINQKIQFHETKFIALTQIGIPTINLNQDTIIQFIEQYKNEIKSNDENVIQKLIGAVGEGYVEKGEEININVETKEIMIQQNVEQLLEICGIKLQWTLEKWKRLIKKTFFVIPYYNMPNVIINKNLSGIERYQIMFETLNLFTLMNRWNNEQMLHQFCQNFPFQAKDEIEIKELVNENELYNIREIRGYLSQIMFSLNNIYQLKHQKEFKEDLYYTANQLQDLTVEYYLSKMKVIQLKQVKLSQTIIEQIEILKYKDENLEVPIQEEILLKCNDNSQERLQKLQQQLIQKKKIQINFIKSKTLLEYFKPIKNLVQNNNNSNIDMNSQNDSREKNEENEKQKKLSTENKSQLQYFDILEDFFQNKMAQQNKQQVQKK